MRFSIPKDTETMVEVTLGLDEDNDVALYYNNIRVGWFGDGVLRLLMLSDSDVKQLNKLGVMTDDSDRIVAEEN